jgi:hypothetical protein
MNKIPFLAVFLFLSLPVQAQNLNSSGLDSLYNVFLSIRNQHASGQHAVIQSANLPHIKCGLGTVIAVRANYNRFTIAQKAVLKSLLDRPATDISVVTPKGYFRVHYDTSGSSKPVYSIDSLLIALDSAYNFEVNYLGYPAPPSDNGAGGDNKYDIYVLPNLGEYGETDPENEVISGSNRYTSYMMIESDFSNESDTSSPFLDYRGAKGINAARVTVAHEFHHAIQMGDYILRYDSDAFFYELTSTSMEHFVYPNLKDYLQYLPSYFYNTQNSFAQNGTYQEYALTIWNIFLKDKFGYDIIKQQWELMPQMRALQAIENSFTNYNTSFGEQFNSFGIWTYYTNYRTIPNKYFEDAVYYPVIRPVANLQMTSSMISVNLNTEPVTNSFVSIVNLNNSDSLISSPDSIITNHDSLTAIITNADVYKGINSSDSTLPFSFSLYNYAKEGSTKLTDNYYESFSADQPSFWITTTILKDKIIDTSAYVVQNIDYVFPSPFSYSKNAAIYIPAKPDAFGSADVYIYNIAMKLVYSINELVLYYRGHKVVKWNGLDNHNNKLSSGVYIYVTKSGNDINKGKLVIFNE